MAEIKISTQAQALIDTLRANPGKAMTFEELANLAGVEAKTGYLRTVKTVLGDALVIDKTEKPVVKTVEVNTYAFNSAE